ncbi:MULTISPECIES: hypothetical protein [Bradyrhizobium]|jgi:hypothetical protein|uniref:Uncharacterized protein n=1 Tax=Bradyrhizobium ottawaense TaxID=931866 RepID=A0A2U8P5X8_9BRAD|nr:MULTISPECIES: hypothetical protein [Bradyrhizobium]AWL92804.1 hypothetical protein CIT37_11730 [Bradyrhizobium ottawaense]MBR1326539.1 hypothetical protein [Bradyrhizobium ottawaense]MBR1332186.1 hypothetical protein [Bradyrhizobium ottawaense]MBR1367776.1 hypothetical protein [Bradyrhizobium ottawaense]MDA9449316.1 hypothetical protein [Bradyrhizobium sp. CCBAU 21360]
MSDSSPSPPAVPPQNQQQRSGCLTALMAIAGIFMLLPGLCALLFGGMSVVEGGQIPSDIASLVFLGLVIGIGGVVLIWAAIMGRKAPPARNGS